MPAANLSRLFAVIIAKLHGSTATYGSGAPLAGMAAISASASTARDESPPSSLGGKARSSAVLGAFAALSELCRRYSLAPSSEGALEVLDPVADAGGGPNRCVNLEDCL